VLIVVMAAGITLIQIGVGERKLGRRPVALAMSAAEPAK
jgi:iron(III) transport system permease protein